MQNMGNLESSSCVECNCVFSHKKLCDPISKCTQGIRIYVGCDENKVTVSISKRGSTRSETLSVDEYGYVTFTNLNSFLFKTDGEYTIRVYSFKSRDILCLEYNCEKTNSFIFEVCSCDSNEIFTINEKCEEKNINCVTEILVKPIVCEQNIQICDLKFCLTQLIIGCGDC